MILLFLACNGDLSGDSVHEDLELLDLGEHTTGDTGFLTDDIVVEVPDDAASVLVHCGDYGDAKLGLVWTLDQPDGSALFDGNAASNAHFKAPAHDASVPYLIPATPDAPLQAGPYTARIYVDGGSPVTMGCEAVVKHGAVPAKATVRVEFVVVGVEGLDATAAADDANVQAMVAEIERALGTAGIELDVNYADFEGNAATYAVVDVTADDYGEFNDLLATANPTDSRTITIFLVQDFQTDEGATILGKAGGPPGAATLNGTAKSGVVVVAGALADDPVFVGRIAAHETGHFLGLYHPTEKDGDVHDIISDTPECSSGATADCAGSGAENLMWWTYNEAATAADLSSQQGQVARGNPVSR